MALAMRAAPSGEAFADSDNDEKHGEGQGHRGQGCSGGLARVVGVHDVVHRVEEKSDAHGQGDLSDVRSDGTRSERSRFHSRERDNLISVYKD